MRYMSAGALSTTDEVIVGNGGPRLGVIRIVNVVVPKQMLVVHRRALTGVIGGRRVLQLQQIIIAASGWMESWRPTAGHDGGRTNTLRLEREALRH